MEGRTWAEKVCKENNMCRILISSLANILTTNLYATETAWYTFDIGYQQKDFQRSRKYKLNETHTEEKAL